MSRALAQWLTERGSLRKMGEALAAGRVSAADLAIAALERIENLDPALNAFIRIDPEQTLREAAEADLRRADGAARSAFDGAPYAVKDLIDVEGWPTTAGARLSPLEPKQADAGAAARLRAAGGVMLGKTGLHELAYGVTSENPHFGAVRNPWDPSRSPGGSSGGSAAAVSAAMAPLALGTDTGCSIRHPAHCCGIVGFKPTHGRVSAAGVAPLVRQMDHVGPLTRSVEDAALAMDLLAGFDPNDPFAAPFPEPLGAEQAVAAALAQGAPQRLRLGRLRGEGFEMGDPETLALAETAIRIVADALKAELVDLAPPGLRGLWRAAAQLFSGDASAVYGEALRRDASVFGEDVRAKLQHGVRVSAGALAAAQEEARRFRRSMELAEQEAGARALLAPTCGAPAPRILMGEDGSGAPGPDFWADYATINCTPFNVTGQPAVSIPCGRTAAGLPVGLMLGGAFGQDAALLGAAARAERALAEEGLWNGERPPL